jgi:hypothetical protein
MALIKSPSIARPVFNLILGPTPSVSAFETLVYGSGTAHVVTMPTGTTDGDILLANIAVDNGDVSMPAGWIQIWKQMGDDPGFPGSRARSAAWWKVAASEGADETITTALSTAGVASLTLIKNAAPPEAWALGVTNFNTTTHRCPSVTLTAVRGLLVSHPVGGWGDFAYNPVPTGMTEMYDLEGGTGSGGQTALMAWQEIIVPGATGVRDFTPTASLHHSSGQIIFPAKFIVP